MTSRGDEGGAVVVAMAAGSLVALGDELLGDGDGGQRRDGTLLGGADGAAGVGELEGLTELLLVLKDQHRQHWLATQCENDRDTISGVLW